MKENKYDEEMFFEKYSKMGFLKSTARWSVRRKVCREPGSGRS